MRNRLLILSTFFGLSACSVVGPDYEAPIADVPSRFVAGQGSSLVSPETQLWWRELNDATLNRLISQGLANNLDIRSALTRIAQADAQLRATGLTAQSSGSLTTNATRSGGEGIPTSDNSTTTLSGSFVIDLFGGVRRGREQALANLEASGFNLGDARAAVTQAIVANYISARFSQEAAALTRQTVSSRRKTLALVRDKRELGSSSELDVAQSEADLFAAQADLEGYISDFEGFAFALATLLDTAPGPLLAKLQKGAPQPNPPSVTALGVPADLMRNIPSVRSAERSFAAAVAALGVKEADLYPSLTLSGSVSGFETDTWSFGPTVTVPVLNLNALRANRDAQIGAVEEADLAWRSAVRAAIEDVETNANALQRSRRQISLLRRASTASARSLELNRVNFEAGETSLFELLEADRTTATRRLSVANETRAAALEWANLQVALGRGWRVGSDQE